MNLDTQAGAVSRSALWSGRILSALVTLFLLFDAVAHMAKPAPVADAFARLGYPLSASFGIGLVEFLCLVAYVVPRTEVLGAVLLTGVLGGAIATHLRVGSPLFEAYIFPFLVGLFAWGGIWLRDVRLRALFPPRLAT
jgi:DoxX-like family